MAKVTFGRSFIFHFETRNAIQTNIASGSHRISSRLLVNSESTNEVVNTKVIGERLVMSQDSLVLGGKSQTKLWGLDVATNGLGRKVSFTQNSNLLAIVMVLEVWDRSSIQLSKAGRGEVGSSSRQLGRACTQMSKGRLDRGLVLDNRDELRELNVANRSRSADKRVLAGFAETDEGLVSEPDSLQNGQ
jgi:hypothetical protein